MNDAGIYKLSDLHSCGFLLFSRHLPDLLLAGLLHGVDAELMFYDALIHALQIYQCPGEDVCTFLEERHELRLELRV